MKSLFHGDKRNRNKKKNIVFRILKSTFRGSPKKQYNGGGGNERESSIASCLEEFSTTFHDGISTRKLIWLCEHRVIDNIVYEITTRLHLLW